MPEKSGVTGVVHAVARTTDVLMVSHERTEEKFIVYNVSEVANDFLLLYSKQIERQTVQKLDAR